MHTESTSATCDLLDARDGEFLDTAVLGGFGKGFEDDPANFPANKQGMSYWKKR
jgi:hypothetical protein